ncbi:transforming growth factor-beta-induced protein ig-h3-like [Dreissena polymorpha]|uniref:FAS1 domain-containing protein n=1 Tax=Dreissena polymorpha TaxID=45954 RepID=A0A9D4QUP9_DREPO|nr:transforming growth factor-beta-induced protein ig-h3-like [Dreissena polymorpha]KAH3843718.1 hypothetical protein DPMN_117248 [Dreissena polymorpha]
MVTLLVGVLVASVAFTYGQTQDILGVLRANQETTLLDLIKTAGLEAALSGPGPFTIFAPSNVAFLRLGYSTIQSLKSDPTALAQVLTYHVINGSYAYNAIHANEMMLTTLAGPKIRVNYYMGKNTTTVQGTGFTRYDLRASNGIVHIIDHVMMAPNGSIMDYISSKPNLSTLKAAIEAAGLTSALSEGPYTLIAPTNDAFEKLGNQTVQALLGNPELLRSILLYHVIRGTLYSVGIQTGSYHTLEDIDYERINAVSGTYITIDGHVVSNKDISVTNGVVHTLSYVLVPSSLAGAVKALANP